jgi:DNA segregation ATPase FtsK/SpoIIIE, S-DNA-T family
MGRKKKVEVEQIGLSSGTKRGLWFLFVLALILLMMLGLFGAGGVVGSWVDVFLALAFGWVRVLVPMLLVGVLYYIVKSEIFDVPLSKYIGMVLLFLGLAGLFHFFTPPGEMQLIAGKGQGGGWLGYLIAFNLQRYVGFVVGMFTVFAFCLAGFLVFFNIPLTAIFLGSEENPGWLRRIWERWQEEKQAVLAEEEDDDEEYEDEEELEEGEEYEEEEEVEADGETVLARDKAKGDGEEEDDTDTEEEEEEIAIKPRKRRRRVKIPIELLDDRNTAPESGDIEQNQRVIQETLENFNIPVEMQEVNVGPTVTQYTLKPAQGIKLTKILALNNDLALALAAHPIRIEAPIPGKSAIGIEVPNKTNAMIGLKQLITNREFKRSKKKGKLLMPLGPDVGGKPYVTALDKLPHLLVAGATGSGKSVFVNGMIIAMLYQYGPDDLKFIMVDPKRVELPIYNRIPHLLTPVITDVKKTINALKWLIVEMDRRYETLAGRGKRNIADYNAVAEEPLPYIVLVIDELADLMIVAANDIENYIIRLAQMARAVGIHLILATQRPSVDVITGLLKANIPGRIAFSVASAIDSKTILDTMGAEKLVGRGDMLFSSAEVSKPKRIQGAYVSEHEVKRVVSFLAEEIGEPEYIEEVIEKQQTPTAFKGGSFDDDDGDELFEEAKALVIAANKASTSYLQRKLRVGYARAARIIDLLEDAGIVGESQGSKGREILVKEDQDDMIEEEEGESSEFEYEESNADGIEYNETDEEDEEDEDTDTESEEEEDDPQLGEEYDEYVEEDDTEEEEEDDEA